MEIMYQVMDANQTVLSHQVGPAQLSLELNQLAIDVAMENGHQPKHVTMAMLITQKDATIHTQ